MKVFGVDILRLGRYPVRDPFFKMLPRSLSNFMNAFTSSDHTTYPFSTTNTQDYKNLMSVYLDATLHPLLKQSDFAQEGWRVGPENPRAEPTESGGPKDGQQLIFKGVVYNEMKGQMSDAGYLYYIRFHEHILPALNNSGGDPQKMTELTYEQLAEFHGQHYHPSNAKIITYGNMPLADHLEELDGRLKTFDHIKVDEDVKAPIDLSSGSQTITVKGPVDPLVPPDAQHKTSISFVMDDGSDVLERFSLSLLSALLIDGYGSPLYRGLIEGGLGTDFSPNTGFDPSTKRSIFSVGLTGVKAADVPLVKESLEQILQDCRRDGFDRIKVDGLLHQLDLGLKHRTAQFGMGIMQKVNGDWHNGLDPFDGLSWQNTVDQFKEKYAKGGYLESLLDKYLIGKNNLTFTMEPSPTYSEELAREETERLTAKITESVQKLGGEAEAYKHLRERELELVKEQEAAAEADLSCLPTLHVKDIPRKKGRKQLRFSEVDGVKVQWREAPTNGLTYFKAINSLHGLPDELRELVPLFSEALMRLGTKNLTTEQLEELIRLKTGGVSVGYHIATSPSSLLRYEEGFTLSGHAFDQNVPDMYDLLRTIITETDFEGPEAETRIRELLQMSANGALDSVASSGHAFARKHAASSLSPSAALTEQTSGLTQVKLTAALASRDSLNDVLQRLRAIQSHVVGSKPNMRVALTCDASSASSNEAALSKFLSSLSWKRDNDSASPAWLRDYTPQARKSFFTLPYQVSYAGIAIPTVPYTDPSGAPLQILSQLLTHKHLHREIREKGGAYGGGAYASGLGGVFGFYSYRDPNPQNTLAVVAQAGAFAAGKNWTEQDMQEAKLSVFQGLDAPEDINAEGMTRFLYGVDEEMSQRRREQLLDTTADDVRRVAQEFLVERADKASITVLGERRPWVKSEDWTFEDLGMAEPKVEKVEEDSFGSEAVIAS